jgi:hypothetical protein
VPTRVRFITLRRASDNPGASQRHTPDLSYRWLSAICASTRLSRAISPARPYPTALLSPLSHSNPRSLRINLAVVGHVRQDWTLQVPCSLRVFHGATVQSHNRYNVKAIDRPPVQTSQKASRTWEPPILSHGETPSGPYHQDDVLAKVLPISAAFSPVTAEHLRKDGHPNSEALSLSAHRQTRCKANTD